MITVSLPKLHAFRAEFDCMLRDQSLMCKLKRDVQQWVDARMKYQSCPDKIAAGKQYLTILTLMIEGQIKLTDSAL